MNVVVVVSRLPEEGKTRITSEMKSLCGSTTFFILWESEKLDDGGLREEREQVLELVKEKFFPFLHLISFLS